MTNFRIPHLRVTSVVVVAGALLVAACSSGSGDTATTTAATTAETTAASSETTDAAVPEPTDGAKPVSGGPTATLPAVVLETAPEGYAPVDVIGEPLPTMTDVPIGDDPAIGQPVPALVGTDADGNVVTVNTESGAAAPGGTMLVFLAHWCPHCNEEVPVLTQMAQEGFLDDVRVIAVSTAADPSQANYPPGEWLKELEWPYESILDGVDAQEQLAAFSAYGGAGFPYVVLIDSDGNLAARWTGNTDAAQIVEYLDTYLS